MKMVLDSRFVMEYFYSDKTETKQKASKKLKELIQRKEGILPTIVISETIQTICEHIGKMKHKSAMQISLKVVLRSRILLR